MENEEPNLVVPRPFPQDPSEALNKSGSLDLTPERPHIKKNGIQKRKLRLKGEKPSSIKSYNLVCLLLASVDSAEENKCPTSPLSCLPARLFSPHLNSTAHVIRRLQEKQEEFAKNPASVFPNPYPLSTEQLHRLGESVQQEPLKVSPCSNASLV